MDDGVKEPFEDLRELSYDGVDNELFKVAVGKKDEQVNGKIT